MYIPRHIESVAKRIAKRKPAVVLAGARQVDKSTMLKEVFHDINSVTLNRPENSPLFLKRISRLLLLMKFRKRLSFWMI